MEDIRDFLSGISRLAANDESSQTYPPDLADLASLVLLIKQEKIISALEYGSGWSTLAIASALSQNAKNLEGSLEIRHPSPFMLTTVDASAHFAGIAINRLKKELVRLHVKSVVAKVSMGTFQGYLSHRFEGLPAVTADLIYLDGPDADQVSGDSNGFHIRFGDQARTYGMPMSSDILEYEAFLWPGTFIVVDGRGANARFLKTHLRREWQYTFSTILDQHFFLLSEEAWGRESSKLLALRSGRGLGEIVGSLESQWSEIGRKMSSD